MSNCESNKMFYLYISKYLICHPLYPCILTELRNSEVNTVHIILLHITECWRVSRDGRMQSCSRCPARVSAASLGHGAVGVIGNGCVVANARSSPSSIRIFNIATAVTSSPTTFPQPRHKNQRRKYYPKITSR